MVLPEITDEMRSFIAGNETSAHLQENGRITFMFCSFSGPPRIMRLYGRGRTILPADSSWSTLRPKFGDFPGVRQIITEKNRSSIDGLPARLETD